MHGICGITAEYNPLHNGHVLHLEEARASTGCGAVAVAMSGDFVQRGEPAIADKWTRAEMALRSGADLVVEIPALFCLGNSFQYASASVAILEALGCSRIAFGSESGRFDTLVRTAAALKENQEAIAAGVSALTKQGLSYPAARAEVYGRLRAEAGISSELIGSELAVMSSPNDILALEYILCMNNAEPAVIKRTGAGHDQLSEEEETYQSASSIRNMLREGRDISPYVPEITAELLGGSYRDCGEALSAMLRYAAVSNSPEEIDDCPSGGEGLGFLLKDAAKKYGSFDEIIRAVKSKRYTYTRISRLCMQLLLGISRTGYPMTGPSYIRVLGFSPKGRELLSGIKHAGGAGMPLITNINKEAASLGADAVRLLGLDIHASDVYNLLNARDVAQRSDHVIRPVITYD